jgi:cellobiose phosphorylase
MRSGQDLLPSEDILSVTSWMYGVFNSHITIGNTNFNKLLTVSRNPLNVLKSSGQRIFVKTANGYELLGMPSAFEMGTTCARWIYKGQEATIIVRTWTSPYDPACFLEIGVEGKEELEFLISNNVVMGDREFDADGQIIIDKERMRVELIPAAEQLMARKYPEAKFFIVSKDADRIERIGGDGMLFTDGKDRNHAYVVLQTKPVRRFTLAFTGNVLSAGRAEELAEQYSRQVPSYEAVQQATEAFWGFFSKQAKWIIESDAEEAAKFNDIVRWYLHNAMVHYTAPHGLEQYSGAAWGLRDVCQGPAELLLATKNFNVLRIVLKKIYSHQFAQTGDWPQWFMFDRYQEIQAADSHADIIIWPLKVLCEYIEATDDLSVLEEEIAFTDFETKTFTEATSTLFAHTLKQIDKIERDCIPGTALVSFGHGDWEDTLQPADPAMRERLVSTWTVELIYQTLRRYQEICRRAGKPDTADRLTVFCGKIKEDFNRYLIKDGVATGLVYFKPDGMDYFLHPSDKKTGVQYRLLPMTRGMISGMFTAGQMQNHLAIIREHLLFPDGVRLMNRPMTYHGGTERYFKRAESAANFGREIGLQYTHAHIRYIEAMAKIGRTEEVYQGLLTILPITIDQVVPSAMRRQSNAYFSSSDANFSDRYEALQQFDRIRRSEVGIKGGWRIYSSGPGMIVAQLILNVLGLRELFSDIVLDPVLPKKLDGLAFDFEYEGKKVRYLYYIEGEGFSPRRVLINGAAVREPRYADNPYRRGGMLIPKAEFNQALNRAENVVEIYI